MVQPFNKHMNTRFQFVQHSNGSGIQIPTLPSMFGIEMFTAAGNVWKKQSCRPLRAQYKSKVHLPPSPTLDTFALMLKYLLAFKHSYAQPSM